jgi:GrpB-like predicted nucleotidyltransferase (UPF0157 family)
MSDFLEIVPYDPAWADAFAVEKHRLKDQLGDLAFSIEHHGSTSVPGLAAKPIIDIQISIRTLHPIDRYVRPLAELGYVHRPHPDDAFAPFFHRPAIWPHTHHIHVVEAGGEEERKTLAFRDYLRQHPDVAHEYELLKRSLAPTFSAMTFETRQAYADAKGKFISNVTRQALADGHPKGYQSRARELDGR